MKTSKSNGQTTYSQHDLGITTEISISAKDFSGKTINHDVANQMHNLRKWQQRVRVSSPKERRLANVLTKMGETCDSIGLSKNVLETASMIYRNLDGHVEVKGKSVVSITAATIYMACKQCDVVRSLEKFVANLSTKRRKIKNKTCSKILQNHGNGNGTTYAPVVTMDKYISKSQT